MSAVFDRTERSLASHQESVGEGTFYDFQSNRHYHREHYQGLRIKSLLPKTSQLTHSYLFAICRFTKNLLILLPSDI
jgi:hypothetical protein